MRKKQGLSWTNRGIDDTLLGMKKVKISINQDTMYTLSELKECIKMDYDGIIKALIEGKQDQLESLLGTPLKYKRALIKNNTMEDINY